MEGILLHGCTHGEFAADHRVHPPAAADREPEAVLRGGPVFSCRSTSNSASFAVSRRSRTPWMDSTVRAARYSNETITRASCHQPHPDLQR